MFALTKPISEVNFYRSRHAEPATDRLPLIVASIVMSIVVLAFLSILEPAEMTSSALNASRLAELALLGLAALIITIAIITRRCPLQLNGKPALLLTVFALWATLSSLWSVSPLLSLARGITLMTMFYVAIGLSIYLREAYSDSVRALAIVMVNSMIMAIAILILLSLLYFGTPLPFTSDMAWSGRPGRLYLAYLVPLETGELLGLAILIAALAIRSTAWKLAVVAGLGLLLYLTDARNVIAFVPTAILAAVLLRRDLMTRFVVSAAAVSAVIALVALGVSGELTQFVPVDIETLNGRTPLWKIAFSQIVDSPVLGIGYYASRFFLGESTSFYAGHTHNAYVEVLLTLGLVGLSLLLVFILYCAKYSLNDRSGILAALLVLCLLGSIFNPLILVSNIHSFFLATSLIVVCDKLGRSARQAEEWRHTDQYFGKPHR